MKETGILPVTNPCSETIKAWWHRAMCGRRLRDYVIQCHPVKKRTSKSFLAGSFFRSVLLHLLSRDSNWMQQVGSWKYLLSNLESNLRRRVNWAPDLQFQLYSKRCPRSGFDSRYAKVFTDHSLKITQHVAN